MPLWKTLISVVDVADSFHLLLFVVASRKRACVQSFYFKIFINLIFGYTSFVSLCSHDYIIVDFYNHKKLVIKEKCKITKISA